MRSLLIVGRWYPERQLHGPDDRLYVYGFAQRCGDGTHPEDLGDVQPQHRALQPERDPYRRPTYCQDDTALTLAGQYTILVRDGTYLNTGDYLLYGSG